VQDSESIQDALKAMATIYACAELTIVDAAGDDADYGLEGLRNSSLLDHIKALRMNNSASPSPLDGFPWTSIWASRGWTFQESLFSRRLLVFGETISWVCGRCIWLEGDFPSTDMVESEIQWPIERDPLVVPIGLIIPKHPSLGRWGNLVERYSERTLTYERDSLNAFAGATEIMSATTPGGIFKGLPVFFFDIALLWQPQETISRRNCDDFALPSWSWTGWKGSINCLESWDPFKSGIYRHTDHHSEWISVVDLAPVASWYKTPINESREVQIRSDFYRFQALRESAHDDLPPNWSRHEHPAGAYFTNLDHPGFKYSYPLPVPQNLETSHGDEYGHILRCTAPRAFVHFDKMRKGIWDRVYVDLITDTSKVIGCLQLHSSGEISGNSKSQELVAVSLGKIKDSKRLDEELAAESPSEWAIKEWEMGFGGSDMFYNVMWIGWDGGIAHRKGLGKVGKEAWNSLQPVVINFKLG
jgi:hypothetical protein